MCSSDLSLVGANTYGKPVGQIARDRAACDDRLRVVAFATQNSARQGDYFDGLASKMPLTCKAEDDLAKPMGDPLEASTRKALDIMAGRTCEPIATGLRGQSADAAPARRQLLAPSRPDAAQREVPGSF